MFNTANFSADSFDRRMPKGVEISNMNFEFSIGIIFQKEHQSEAFNAGDVTNQHGRGISASISSTCL